MSYDLGKYRDKRERVLGVKKRGVSFSVIVVIFMMMIFAGTGFVIIPQAITSIKNRNLDDAIIKPLPGFTWSDRKKQQLSSVPGIVNIKQESQSGRVIITFNRAKTNADTIMLAWSQDGSSADLLNVVGHSERMKIMKKEQEFEAL